MTILDILIATLVLFPRLTEWAWSETADGELSDWGVPLLVVALAVMAVRHRSWRVAAAVLAALLGLGLLWRLGAFENQTVLDVLRSLTRGPGAIPLVALFAVAVRRWSHEPWERSFFVRLGTRLARAWHAVLLRWPRGALWSAAAAVGALFFCVALLRHLAFESHGYDLGIFTNAIWNLTHGNGYVSSVKGGINLFADHQSPTFWLLAPLFALIPRPETLLFAQAFGLAAGGPALYYLGVARFGREHWAPGALPWLYWAYLPLRNANAFDFHPEVFMLPLFLWAFAGFVCGRAWAKALGVLALAAALGAKESAPVVAVGIGIAWALTSAGSRNGRWAGIALAAAGVALFLFDVKVVPRWFAGEDYPYLSHYQRFGGGIADLFLAPFTQPGYFFSQLINGPRLNFLFWTLAPLGFLPLFEWRAALAALPPYLMLFLSEGDQRVRLVFHYGIEPGSALFWALPLGLAAFAARFGWRVAGIWMFFWALACFGPGEIVRSHLYAPVPHSRWLAKEVVPCVDPQAALAASDRLIPHLATRSWVGYPDQLEQRPSGEPVRCVVTDLALGNNWPLGRGGVERVLAGLPERGYREAWRCGDVSVYQLRDSACLRCVPRCR
ncbi:MAG TPA: DUF2079 domain-containing protein [Burkholderiales bacterium]